MEVTCSCLQHTQWTYVIGFYQPSWLQMNIFTMNQSELEMATEKLSDMLESEEILKWCEEKERVDMINQTNQVLSSMATFFHNRTAYLIPINNIYILSSLMINQTNQVLSLSLA